MDPYGLTFEIYDAIGRYRTKDGNKDVDASSKGLPAIGDVANAIELMDKMSKNETVRGCVTRQWFRYAFGRDGGEERRCHADHRPGGVRSFRLRHHRSAGGAVHQQGLPLPLTSGSLVVPQETFR